MDLFLTLLSGIGWMIVYEECTAKEARNYLEKMREENRALRQKRAELLVANGYPADYTDIRYRCEACGDTGFIGTKMCRCMRDEFANSEDIYHKMDEIPEELCVSKVIGWQKEICMTKANFSS